MAEEEFIIVRSKCCKKVLLEATISTRGLFRKKCDGCGKMRIVSLPIENQKLEKRKAVQT